MAGSVDAAGTAGAGQSQPTEIHADQPQHQGHDGPGSPAAGADTTGGAAQSQPTDDQADQPHHGGHEGPGSPVGDADSTVGEVGGEAEVDDVEVDSCARIVDEVADAGQFCQFGIKLDC